MGTERRQSGLCPNLPLLQQSEVRLCAPRGGGGGLWPRQQRQGLSLFPFFLPCAFSAGRHAGCTDSCEGSQRSLTAVPDQSAPLYTSGFPSPVSCLLCQFSPSFSSLTPTASYSHPVVHTEPAVSSARKNPLSSVEWGLAPTPLCGLMLPSSCNCLPWIYKPSKPSLGASLLLLLFLVAPSLQPHWALGAPAG